MRAKATQLINLRRRISVFLMPELPELNLLKLVAAEIDNHFTRRAGRHGASTININMNFHKTNNWSLKAHFSSPDYWTRVLHNDYNISNQFTKTIFEFRITISNLEDENEVRTVIKKLTQNLVLCKFCVLIPWLVCIISSSCSEIICLQRLCVMVCNIVFPDWFYNIKD